MNVYLSNSNGSNTALVLFAKGVTGMTYYLNSSTWNGQSFANGTGPPLSNGTSGSLAAGTYYLNFTETNGFGETSISTESSQLTVSSGNIPRVTFPALQGGNVARNLYITAVNGSSGTEVLYATGITTTTYDLAQAASSNSYAVSPPLVNTTGLTYPDANGNTIKSSLSLIRSAKDNNLEDAYRHLRGVVAKFNQGEPVSFTGTLAKFRHAHAAFAVFAQLCSEMGTLIDANPGHFATAPSGIGTSQPRRSWP